MLDASHGQENSQGMMMHREQAHIGEKRVMESRYTKLTGELENRDKYQNMRIFFKNLRTD